MINIKDVKIGMKLLYEPEKGYYHFDGVFECMVEDIYDSHEYIEPYVTISFCVGDIRYDNWCAFKEELSFMNMDGNLI